MPIINQIVKGSGGVSSGPKIPMQVVPVDPQDPTAGTALKKGPTGIDVGGADSITSDYMFYRCYYSSNYNCSGPALLNSQNLKKVSCSNGFYSAFREAGFTSTGLGSIETIGGSGCFAYAFAGCPNLTSTGIDWSKVTFTYNASSATNGSCGYMFQGCASLTSTGFENNNELCADYQKGYTFAYTFSNCTALTSTGMNNISVLDASYLCYHMFDGCTGLTSPGLESVEFISDNNCCAYMYKGCTGITIARLTSLIGNRPVSSTSCFTHMFDGCTNLTDVYMDSVHINAFAGSSPSSEFSAFLSGVSGCTVHLPSNMTSMASWSFGGTNTVVVNDLSPTYMINTDETGTTSNELYCLSKKRSTANYLTWIRYFSVSDLVSEWEFVYTSGSEIPSVGDYVYSDPECTVQGKAIVSVNG